MSRSHLSSRVNIAKLKTHLGQYLKLVKSGTEVTVMDRQVPVALLIPLATQELSVVSSATQSWSKIDAKWSAANTSKKTLPLKKSVLDYLKDDRGSR